MPASSTFVALTVINALTIGIVIVGAESLVLGGRRYEGEVSYNALVERLAQSYDAADLSAVVRLLATEFPEYPFSLKALFTDRQREVLAALPMPGKANGAVGNYNAHLVACPELDWPRLAQRLVGSLGHAVIVANAHKLRAISQSQTKSDREDARKALLKEKVETIDTTLSPLDAARRLANAPSSRVT